MHSQLCVSMALCLVLAASAGCNVIRTQEFPLSPAGLTVDVVVRNKEHHTPVMMFSIDIDENTKKVTVSNFGVVPDPGKHVSSVKPSEDFVPSLENRHGFRVGFCPEGFIRRGGFCFPDDDK